MGRARKVGGREVEWERTGGGQRAGGEEGGAVGEEGVGMGEVCVVIFFTFSSFTLDNDGFR